jgi:AraC-like DNA-binding protein
VETSRRTRIAGGRLAGGSWERASREPCALLRPHVRGLRGYDERWPGPRSRRELPEPFVVVIIEIGPTLRVSLGGDERGAARHRGGFVAGLGDRFAITRHEGSQRGVQVDLTPTGARRLFGLPLSEVAGRIVALRDLLPREHAELVERLSATSDWTVRLDLVEALLAGRILEARVETARVDWALAQIEASGGTLDVGALARELGHSHKHLISLFHDQVGVTPKLLARLVRFERVMARARTDSPPSWAELALEHGYFDQAHLVRDFRRFTGLTPTEARRELTEPPPG